MNLLKYISKCIFCAQFLEEDRLNYCLSILSHPPCKCHRGMQYKPDWTFIILSIHSCACDMLWHLNTSTFGWWIHMYFKMRTFCGGQSMLWSSLKWYNYIFQIKQMKIELYIIIASLCILTKMAFPNLSW